MASTSWALPLVTAFVSANAPNEFDPLAMNRMATVIASNSDLTRLFQSATRGRAATVAASRAVATAPVPCPALPPALLKRGRYGSSGGMVPARLLLVPSSTRE